MAFSINKENRNVLPIWRDFKRTVELGELSHPSKIVKKEIVSPDFNELVDSWQRNSTLFHATDLFSALVVSNELNSNLAKEVADFIKNHPDSNLFQQEFITNSFLNFGKKDVNDRSNILEYEKIKQYISDFEGNGIFKKIQKYKKLTHQFPKNPINYVELSRLHTSIGQLEKADFYIQIALKLNSTNRFVVRSAARFYLHKDDPKKARHYLKSSKSISNDPWLMASEIAISEKIGKHSNNIKKGMVLLKSGNFNDFDLSELRSAIATVQLFDGKVRNSRKLFRHSLINPNNNSIAQAEWASNKYNLFDVNPEMFNVNNNFEAIFYDSVEHEKWQKSFENSLLWYLDTPYSTDPVIQGAHIASTFLDDFDKASTLLKYGLHNNPKDALLINNLAYCQVKNKDTLSAIATINKIKHLNPNSLPNSTRLCIVATTGLIALAQGNFERGIHMYDETISLAKKLNDKSLENLATVNLALALPKGHARRKEIVTIADELKIEGDSEINVLVDKLKGLSLIDIPHE